MNNYAVSNKADQEFARITVRGRSYLGSCEYQLSNRHQLFDRVSDLLRRIEQMLVIQMRITRR